MKARLLPMVLVAVMLLGTLTACGQPSSTGESAVPAPPSKSASAPLPSASPTPSASTPSQTKEPVVTTSPSPSPSPTPSPSPEPEETVDPSSKLLPDLEAFLYRSASSRSYFGDIGRWGRWFKWNGSHPYVAYETITQELLDLLSEDRYQLKLTGYALTPSYSKRAIDYYFEYTGTSEDIALLTDEEGLYTFHVRLRFYPYPEHDYFQFSFAFSEGFVLEDPGTRTTRNIQKGGDGSVITSPPDTGSDGDDFFKKCSSCHGSGKCTHCNGKGEVEKFQAGLGWVDLDCTLCNNGKCRHCNGTGKDR